MSPIAIAILVGISAYIIIIALIPRRMLKEGSTSYTRNMLHKLESAQPGHEGEGDISVLREQAPPSDLAGKVFMALPGSKKVYPSLLRAGMENNIGRFLIYCLIVFAITLYASRSMGSVGIIVAVVVAYLFGWRYIKRQIDKRNNAFLNFFPDALDMIVRSVRSGYPLNSAIRMVAENVQPPVSIEFKQVADEVAYGSTMMEALHRLALRIDEPDVHFFIVVLNVQQDVGGNLSEVLSNLSGVIRKRKYMRLKIRALSSEGRATAWVLGSMPVLEAAAIQLVSPTHLTPLFATDLGHIFLAGTIGVAGIGVFIVKQIVNIKV